MSEPAPCNPGLRWHSPLNHDEIRKLTEDGRCPICDDTVPRSTYYAILERILREPELRARIASKKP